MNGFNGSQPSLFTKKGALSFAQSALNLVQGGLFAAANAHVYRSRLVSRLGSAGAKSKCCDGEGEGKCGGFHDFVVL